MPERNEAIRKEQLNLNLKLNLKLLKRRIAENRKNRNSFIGIALLILVLDLLLIGMNSPATPVEVMIIAVGCLALTSGVFALSAGGYQWMIEHETKKIRERMTQALFERTDSPFSLWSKKFLSRVPYSKLDAEKAEANQSAPNRFFEQKNNHSSEHESEHSKELDHPKNKP